MMLLVSSRRQRWGWQPWSAQVLCDADLRGPFVLSGLCRGCPGRDGPPGTTGSSPGHPCMRDPLQEPCDRVGAGNTSLFLCLQQQQGLSCLQVGTGASTVALQTPSFNQTLTDNLVWYWRTWLFWEMFSIRFSSHIWSLLPRNSPLAWNVLPNWDCNSDCVMIFELFSSKIMWIMHFSLE